MAIINGDSRNNRLKGSVENDTVTGFGGSDWLTGSAGSDIIYGDDQALTVPFGFGADTLLGGGGHDALIGGAGNDVLIGGGGDDLLIAGLAAQVQWSDRRGTYLAVTTVDAGNDQIDGGGGTDRAVLVLDRAFGVQFDMRDASKIAEIYSNGTKIGSITGVESVEFYGGRGVDTVVGGVLDDVLRGRGGNDVLSGGEGMDLLDGGAGDDVLDGGSAFDVASYAEATAGVTIDMALIGQAQATGGAGIDTLINIEQVDGSAFADRLTGSDGRDFMTGGNGGNDLIDGGAGDDFLTIERTQPGPASVSRLIGGTGADSLFVQFAAGVTDRVHVFGGASGDFANLTVQGGSASVDLGGGDDDVSFWLGAGETRVTLGGGVDTIALHTMTAGSKAGVITDFAAGDNGDRINMTALLYFQGDYEGGDFFDLGFARLVDSAAGTAVQVDLDGPGGAAGFVTALLLNGTDRADCTAFNFGGYDPAGVAGVPIAFEAIRDPFVGGMLLA